MVYGSYIWQLWGLGSGPVEDFGLVEGRLKVFGA